MREWKVIWLPPIYRGDLEDSKIILDKFKGVYIWKHKPTNQVLYIGQTGKSFYERVYEVELNGLKKGNWNIYDFVEERDFGKMLRKYLDFPTDMDMEVNKDEVIYIPNASNSSEIWNRCWRSKVDDYISDLQFLFCTGEWSFDLDKRHHIESLLLWEYKRYYAGPPRLEKDTRRISIGKIPNPGLDAKEITFNHIGCIENIPRKVLDTLQKKSIS